MTKPIEAPVTPLRLDPHQRTTPRPDARGFNTALFETMKFGERPAPRGAPDRPTPPAARHGEPGTPPSRPDVTKDEPRTAASTKSERPNAPEAKDTADVQDGTPAAGTQAAGTAEATEENAVAGASATEETVGSSSGDDVAAAITPADGDVLAATEDTGIALETALTGPLVTDEAAPTGDVAAEVAPDFLPEPAKAAVIPAEAALAAGLKAEAEGKAAATAGAQAGAEAVSVEGRKAGASVPLVPLAVKPAAGELQAGAEAETAGGLPSNEVDAPQAKESLPESALKGLAQALGKAGDNKPAHDSALTKLDLPAGLIDAQSRPVALSVPGLTAAAPAGEPIRELPRPTPIPALALEVGMQALRGATRFAIRLDPAELGRVEVTLDIAESGEVKASLVVDRVETLQLLKREASTLEQAFEQAGLRNGNDGLSFSLRGERGGEDGRREGQEHKGPASEDLPPEIQAVMRRMSLPTSHIDLII